MAERRTKGVLVTRPVVYGNTATDLGKRGDDERTHSWKVFVRSVDGSDLGTVVKKVVFQLHESFAEPKRTVEVRARSGGGACMRPKRARSRLSGGLPRSGDRAHPSRWRRWAGASST